MERESYSNPAIAEMLNRWIGIGLALHHVAPMAGVIAHGEKDRLVLTLCLRKRFFSPRVPLDGIVSVQQEVRTLLVNQPVSITVLTLAVRDPDELVAFLGFAELSGEIIWAAPIDMPASAPDSKTRTKILLGEKACEEQNFRSVPCLRSFSRYLVAVHLDRTGSPGSSGPTAHRSFKQCRVVNEIF